MGNEERTVKPMDIQSNWFALRDMRGDAGARAEVARWLRWAAEQVEAVGHYPDVFGVQIPEDDWSKRSPITTISVTLSYPWGG